jgi:hypothetical protein
MKKRILVVYYSQTGQLTDIVKSVTSPMQNNDELELVFEELRPKPLFPFPWTSDDFFQAMPESVMGIPCEIESFSFSGDSNFDLIVIAYQPWYLSPSIPFHAFFQQAQTRQLLSGKPVITVIGSRNMWVMAQRDVKQYILKAGGQPVGNIVLRDRAPNLLSVVSIIRWMMKGKRDRYLWIFPPAGISEKDIGQSVGFGTMIRDALLQGSLENLRDDLAGAGAVEVLPQLVMLEKRGKLFFRIWAAMIIRKGTYGDPKRAFMLRLFKYYLLLVLYLISPFAIMVYYLSKPFRKNAIRKQIMAVQHL